MYAKGKKHSDFCVCQGAVFLLKIPNDPGNVCLWIRLISCPHLITNGLSKEPNECVCTEISLLTDGSLQ